MSESAVRLVGLLADGELHSGARLASQLGMTRAAIWKLVAELRDRGIAVEAQDRRGYRLAQPVELLDVQALRHAAAAVGHALPDATEVLFEIGSTNEFLHAASAPPPDAPRLVFAERHRQRRQGRTAPGQQADDEIVWRQSHDQLEHPRCSSQTCRVRHGVAGLQHLEPRTVHLVARGGHDSPRKFAAPVLVQRPRHRSGRLARADDDRATPGRKGQAARHADRRLSRGHRGVEGCFQQRCGLVCVHGVAPIPAMPRRIAANSQAPHAINATGSSMTQGSRPGLTRCNA